MKIYTNPPIEEWPKIISRPYIKNDIIEQKVKSIISNVIKNGDQALSEYTKTFDGVNIKEIKTSKAEIEQAQNSLDTNIKNAILLARKNITKFHKTQKHKEPKVETSRGVSCWRESRAIERVGLYIPGGTAPLFSSILMLAIPAQIAGCKEIIICTPPQSDGRINSTTLYTAELLGINKIYKVGGAQAIAAMAYGTKSIPKVDKIFGPGNQYVTTAKSQVQAEGTSIDTQAGPSELLVIADQNANPKFVAADLLSQAEHGPDSQVILVSNNSEIINTTIKEIKIQVDNISRKDIAISALKNSKAILLSDINECITLSNFYAPEHLILNVNTPKKYLSKITNAGSVFIGQYSCESAGDYLSGTNHTLPTNGYAKSQSGVSVDSFVKKITFQEINKTGIQNIGTAIEVMAIAEGLEAHKNAVSIRLKTLINE